MEALIVVFVLLFLGAGIANFILLIVFNAQTNKKLQSISLTLNRLMQMFTEKGIPVQPQPDLKPSDGVKPVIPTPEIKPEKPIIPTPPVEEKKVPKKVIPAFTAPIQPTIVKETIPEKPKVIKPPTDWEKFFGENLMNKIGIIILVLGIAFFVKFAIDKNWINEQFRVAIGYLSGIALIGVAHNMRNKYRTFSSVLVGGGMSVMYFTTAIALKNYALFSQTTAFLIMVVITAMAIILSILYDRKTLAVLSLLGGFLTPYIVSTGTGNYIVLFTYLSILNIGLLTLSYFRRWRFLHVLAFAFTVLFYGSWLGLKFDHMEAMPINGALLYAAVFFLIFYLTGIINNIREKSKFDGLDIGIFISNAFLFYSVGLYVLQFVEGGLYKGPFTAGVAAVNMIAATYLWKRISIQVNKNLIYLLLGLVLTFVSLIAPVQLDGAYITIFWGIEAAILIWLWKQTGLQLTSIFSALVTGCTFISLLMDWEDFQSFFYTKPAFDFGHPYFVTGITVAIALYVIARLLSNLNDEKIVWFVKTKIYRRVIWTLFYYILYLVLYKEVHYQSFHHFTTPSAIATALSILMFAYAAMLTFMAKKYAIKGLNGVMLFINISLVFTYLIDLNNQFNDLRSTLIADGTNAGIFAAHYVVIALLIWLLARSYIIINEFSGAKTGWKNVYLWFMVFTGIFMASLELQNAFALLFSQNTTDMYAVCKRVDDAGFPILWGICSVILINLGMKFKMRVLRIISLTLTGVTIFKLAITVAGMSKGVQVAAFIGLGLILLFISFIYQKLNLLSSDNAERSDS